MNKTLFLFFSLSVFIFSCGKDDDGSVDPGETPQSLLEGYWYTGPATKYNYSGDTQTSTQELGASNVLIIYHSDSTTYHDGTGETETYELNSAGTEILLSENTLEERVYQVQKLTADSLIVYGPFTSTGERYDPSALYTLRHYRK